MNVIRKITPEEYELVRREVPRLRETAPWRVDLLYWDHQLVITRSRRIRLTGSHEVTLTKDPTLGVLIFKISETVDDKGRKCCGWIFDGEVIADREEGAPVSA